MRSLPTLACLTLIALLVPQASAHQTVSATSSTGNVDTWGIGMPDGPELKFCWTGGTNWEAVYPCPEWDVIGPCPADLYIFTVKLRLLDASPGDAVAITVVGDGPGAAPIVQGLVSGRPLADPTLYPSDVATYADPVAEVPVSLGGCNRATTVAVTGLVVDGEVAYELTY